MRKRIAMIMIGFICILTACAPAPTPTALPTSTPTPTFAALPTLSPTATLTPAPTVEPTQNPTEIPTMVPTAELPPVTEADYAGIHFTYLRNEFSKNAKIYYPGTEKVAYTEPSAKEWHIFYFSTNEKAIWKHLGKDYCLRVILKDSNGNKTVKTGTSGAAGGWFVASLFSESSDPFGEAVFKIGKGVVPEGAEIVELDIGQTKAEMDDASNGTVLWRK